MAIPSDGFDDFDHEKRVAISARGVITVIRGSQLLSFEAEWVSSTCGLAFQLLIARQGLSARGVSPKFREA